MDSSKVDAMGREAKQDAKLGYKTIPLCITFLITRESGQRLTCT